MAYRLLHGRDLERVGTAAASVHRRLLRMPSPVLAFTALSGASSAGTSHITDAGPGWLLRLQLGSVPLVLQAPAGVWPYWTPDVTGGDVPSALLSAAIAHAGTPLWQALAQATGGTVHSLHAHWLRHAPPPPASALAWHLRPLGWRGSLHAGTDAAWAHWAGALSATAGDPADVLAVEPSMPVPITLELGRTRLPASDLRRLRPHAVLLIENGLARQRTVRVLAGCRRTPLAWALWESTGRLRRQAQPCGPLAMQSSFEGEPSMSNTTGQSDTAASKEPANGAAEQLALGSIEVEVRFELARQQWPLQELAQWRVGEALPLELPLADAGITAWVGDRCVARGRLVVIGERLGLRVDAVHASPDPSAH